MNQLELIDALNRKTSQLSALLTLINGTGFQSFREANDEVANAYIWAASDLAKDVQELANRLTLSA